MSGNSNGNEMLNFLFANKAYVAPHFTIRKIEERKKMVGHENFKKWQKMVELDLKALLGLFAIH